MNEHGIVHSKSQGLIDAAYRFAKEAHGTQVRKYTDEPYITHPVAVAKIVASVTGDCEMISAALLHDVIEDTSVGYNDIVNAGFGKRIANYVLDLTDVSVPEDGNRAYRKKLDRLHLASVSSNAKTIKLADLIHNTSSILEHDRNFAKTYMAEKKLLLEVLREGDMALYEQASKIVQDYYKDVNNG